MLKQGKWQLVGRPVRGGQRFFRWTRNDGTEGVRVGLYVADDSGRNPDHTDEGPLRIAERVVRLGQLEARGLIYGFVKVVAERTGKEGRVGLNALEAQYLAKDHGFQVLYPQPLAVLRDLFAMAAPEPQKTKEA